ncbi:hemolysin family protein [Archangium lipolyticum]|uniref:hemolysin family protein n=1 Tax=Archangium lipolyticum TaxID=2970465 RepID=UPI002149ABE9|nr:hemolysin family protein [Archangium lipolyticum]
MHDLVAPFVIALLILVNAFFVAAEFSLLGAPRTAIDRRAEKGSKRALRVRELLRDPRQQDRYIATAQVGITFASLGLGMYGEHVVAEWLASLLESLGGSRWAAAHTLASILSVTLLTYLHIVLGEMIPKTLALHRAEHSALWISTPIRWVSTVLFPVVVLLNSMGNGVLRLMGVRRTGGSTSHSPEELRFVVEESQHAGHLRQESGQVMKELLRFGERTAGEAATPRVRLLGIPLGASPEVVRGVLRQSNHTRYPVYAKDLDHIVGMVHIKDLLRVLSSGDPLTYARVRPVPFVPRTVRLDDVLSVMRREKTQMVVVMDELGGTAGLLTIEDLFEEVVGDIDEGVPTAPVLQSDGDGHLIAEGIRRLDEVGKQLGLDLTHDEVDTVSGLVLALLGRPPHVGDVVDYGEVRLEVTNVEGRGVKECRIQRLAPPDHAAPEESAAQPH